MCTVEAGHHIAIADCVYCVVAVLRDFGGHECTHEMFQEIAKELWRITMPDGVVAKVVLPALIESPLVM